MQNHVFKLKPSRFYCVFLSLTVCASLLIISLLSLNFWIKVIGVVVAAVYGSMIFWRYALLRGKLSIVSLEQIDGAVWRVTTPSGNFEASLRGDSTVTSIISVLRFDNPPQKIPLNCIILRDSLHADDYRRLVGVVRMGTI